MSVTYRTTIQQTGNNTGIRVPDEVLDDLGAGRRPKVVADVDGHVMSASVVSMGGRALLAFGKAHREASGFAGGREVTVTIRLDDDAERLGIPGDLAGAYTQAKAHPSFVRSSATCHEKRSPASISWRRSPGESRARPRFVVANRVQVHRTIQQRIAVRDVGASVSCDDLP